MICWAALAFDIGRAVNDGAVGLRDRDRILPAAAFEVDGRGALGGTVVRGRNGDPLERAAADAFGDAYNFITFYHICPV